MSSMTTKTMRAVAVTGKEQVTQTVTPVPTPGPAEALIRVAYCGICGSDVPRYFDGAVHAYPQVLGHEFSGVVEAVGDAVDNVEPGDE